MFSTLSPQALLRQCHALRWHFAACTAFILFVLGGMFGYWYFTGRDVAYLTRDPIAILETELLKIQRNPTPHLHDLAELYVPFYAGAVSNLGVLLWTVAAAATALASMVLRHAARREEANFFLSATVVSILMLFDDFYLIHERALPIYLGIREEFVFAAYGLIVLFHLVRFRTAILRSDFLLLAAAFACFAVSLGVDLVPLPLPLPQPHFFEDGPKFAGIVFWCAYHLRIAQVVLGGTLDERVQKTG